MKILNPELGLYTDMYQLTMMQSYFAEGMHNNHAAFDYFFRKLPFDGGFVVFAGLTELLESLSEVRFSDSDIDYLHSLNMNPDFLDFLRSFSFRGKLTAVDEGTIIFPLEPAITVEGSLLEAQLIETLLLNVINFNSLIATKAARIKLAAGDRLLSEFGLRRSQGYGGLQASRAAVIGGFNSTSNVLASKMFGLTPAGTMAHSYIQSFDDELTAFRKYAESNPKNCILLVDTFNTLKSGVPNAITVAKELELKGHRLRAIRLDSGDLAYLSFQARKMLDNEGLHYVKIVVSNQLDEIVIKSLLEQGAPIDIFGVGTSLVTGNPDSALDGIYKLSLYSNIPKLKLTENISKMSLPGLKNIIRFFDNEDCYHADAVVLRDEPICDVIYHPFEMDKSFQLKGYKAKVLTGPVMENGEIKSDILSINELREKVNENLLSLPPEYKRFVNPHLYKVGLSRKLINLRDEIRAEYSSDKFLKHTER